MSHVSLQDSVNPKPLSEGIAEEYPRQLAPSVGTLSAQGKSSAVPVTSAAFLLESPTPSDPKDSIRCGSFEFVPHPEAPHPIPAESCGGMNTTFGGVHFIIDSGGFLRLPRTSASGPRTSVGRSPQGSEPRKNSTQRAKKDATIARLRAKIVSLEATVKAQEDQLMELEEEGEDIQGGAAFLSDDEDFEEDEDTDMEDYEFGGRRR
ncbi:hypothetical protein QYE76_023591 [Lolium multiflorum]|uniref:Uncharacterized protein n=1 Tax=Lolium multiflorum TaxID=4521 RepID=A0AAD8REQ7_LOLMU|nr:hypothetical protein QYE76_023591 [Lolium multiflorum]